jgi:hypothetical protein
MSGTRIQTVPVAVRSTRVESPVMALIRVVTVRNVDKPIDEFLAPPLVEHSDGGAFLIRAQARARLRSPK